MHSRKDYMDGKVSFEDYYLEIADAGGVGTIAEVRPWLPRIKAALAAGDAHLNSIPLAIWDAIAVGLGGPLTDGHETIRKTVVAGRGHTLPYRDKTAFGARNEKRGTSPALRQALRERGDFWALGSGVCIVKTVARRMAAEP